MVYVKNPFNYHVNDDGSGERRLSDVKSLKFRSQHDASVKYSDTKDLGYKDTL